MKIKNVLPVIMLVAIFASAIAGCHKSSNNSNTTPVPVAANSVSIKGYAFSVTSLTVAAGTKVTWTNNDAVAHTVTADDNSYDSGNLAPGATYSKTFTTAGTYSYHCTYHSMMKASVVVQ